MNKVNTKKYNTNLAAEFHVLSVLHRLGHTATLALGYEATMELGDKKHIDIVIFMPDGRTVKIDVIGIADKKDWPIDTKNLGRKRDLYIVLVSFSGKIKDPNEPPLLWVVPYREIKNFIKEYKTKTVISYSKILKEGEKYFRAWDKIA